MEPGKPDVIILLNANYTSVQVLQPISRIGRPRNLILIRIFIPAASKMLSVSIKVQAETHYTHISLTVLNSSFGALAATYCPWVDLFLLSADCLASPAVGGV